jgi:hypothetical protein
MDQLEKFIQENQASFDASAPSSSAWEKIQERREEKKPKRFTIKPFDVFRYAAAVLVLALAGVGVFSLLNPEEQELAEQQAELPEELVELEYFYESQVSARQVSLKEALALDTVTFNEIEKELEFLNKEKEQLLEEFGSDISNERVVEELIEIYRLRLNILNNVLSTIKSNNNQQDETSGNML